MFTSVTYFNTIVSSWNISFASPRQLQCHFVRLTLVWRTPNRPQIGKRHDFYQNNVLTQSRIPFWSEHVLVTPKMSRNTSQPYCTKFYNPLHEFLRVLKTSPGSWTPFPKIQQIALFKKIAPFPFSPLRSIVHFTVGAILITIVTMLPTTAL